MGQGFQEHELGVLRLRAGASVLRMTVKGTDNAVRLRSIRVEETARPSGRNRLCVELPSIILLL